jgi:hypothetical protein
MGIAFDLTREVATMAVSTVDLSVDTDRGRGNRADAPLFTIARISLVNARSCDGGGGGLLVLCVV